VLFQRCAGCVFNGGVTQWPPEIARFAEELPDCSGATLR